MVDDRSGENDAEAAAHSEDGGQDADRDAHVAARQLVSDDADGERQDASGSALEHAREDEDWKTRRKRGQQGAGGQYEEHHQQHPPFADHVPQPAQDGGQYRRCE